MNVRNYWKYWLLMRENLVNKSTRIRPLFVFFSKSTSQAMQESIKEALGLLVVQQYEKYLGLLSFISRKKKESFDKIKQRMWKKL